MRIFICEHHRYRSSLMVGSHRFAEEFLRRGHEVVWFSHPRTTLHRARTGRLPPVSTVHKDGVREITLRAIAPYIGIPVLESVNWGRRWLSRNGNVLRKLGLDRCDLLWVSDFTMLGILDLVEAGKVVFRFFDRIDKFERMPRTIFELVDFYRSAADVVIASSSAVCDDLRIRGLEVVHVPNAVDAGRFPRELAIGNSRPLRVTYVGALRWWFDLETVEHWAQALPDVEFLVVGPNEEGMRSSLPNLIFSGPVPDSELPALLAAARFGIIPFKLNDLTRAVHPLKLYEYLAAGCQVLSAKLPDVREIPGAVFTYAKPSDGIEILKNNLDRRVDREMLRNIAIAHSWARRVDNLAGHLGFQI